jgi:hypothetical protein
MPSNRWLTVTTLPENEFASQRAKKMQLRAGFPNELKGLFGAPAAQ